MQEVGVITSKIDDAIRIEFQFKALDQLLDSSDPSVLPRQELTEFAEGYIAGHLEEYRLKRVTELIISLPEEHLTPDMYSLLPDAIHRHFGFRINDLDHEMRLSLREGRISLALAFGNALIAVAFFAFFGADLSSTPILLLGGLISILNWVTIWDTYEYFVYDYRHLVRRHSIYRKVSSMDIQVSGRKTAGTPASP
jgi:hypothetical protein